MRMIRGSRAVAGLVAETRWLASLLGTQLGDTLGTAELRHNPFAQLPFAPLPFGFHRAKRQFLRLAGLWFKLLDHIS